MGIKLRIYSDHRLHGYLFNHEFMTRQEAINRWKEIVETVFWAEEAIAKEWDAKLKAAPSMSKEEQQKFADGYCQAIATEIISRTSDEELEKLE